MRKRRQSKAGRCYHLVSRIAHRAFFFDGKSTHAAGVAPIDAPKKWTVLLERGSNAVAAKLLTLLEGGEKSAAEIAEASEIKSRPFLTNRYLVPLMAKGLIRQTLPDKPKSRFQRYALA